MQCVVCLSFFLFFENRIWKPFNNSEASILSRQTLMLSHVLQSKMVIFPPETFTECCGNRCCLQSSEWKAHFGNQGSVHWGVKYRKKGKKITDGGIFKSYTGVEIRVMKGICGASRRLALGGVALVYPDQWWRWFRVVFATVGYGPAGLKETGRSWGKGNELGGYRMELDLYAFWTQPELLFFTRNI